MNQNLNDFERTYWIGYMLHSLGVFDMNNKEWDIFCEEYTMLKLRSVNNLD